VCRIDKLCNIVISDEQSMNEAGVAVASAASVTLASAVAALGPCGGPEDISQRLLMFISSRNSEAAAAARGADSDSVAALACVQPDNTVIYPEPS